MSRNKSNWGNGAHIGYLEEISVEVEHVYQPKHVHDVGVDLPNIESGEEYEE